MLSNGPVAREVSASFDLYWNHELSYPITTLAEELPTEEDVRQRKIEFDAFVAQQYESKYMQHLRNSEFAELLREEKLKLSWGVGDVVADDPDKLTEDTSHTDYRLVEQLRPKMEAIEKELIIFSPYFVPGKEGVAFFQSLRDKGVRVRIPTNALSTTDVSVVHAGYSRYRKKLLRMGVELHELNLNLSREERKNKNESGIGGSRASLHAKAFVMDRKRVFVDSLNLDPRSIVQNTEIGVIFESEAIAKRIAEGFDKKIEELAFRLELESAAKGNEQISWHGVVDGEDQIFNVDPYTSFWKRFGVGLLRLLPIESQI